MATRTDIHQGTSQIRCTTCRRSGWITYTATTTTSDNDNIFRQTTTVTHTPTGTAKTLTRKGDLDRFRLAAARRIFDCGHPLKAVTVTGVINTEHACGPRCLNAVGPSCECSCGGANHGTGHGDWSAPTTNADDTPMTAADAEAFFAALGVQIRDDITIH